jgi:hypothetical protein
MLRFCFLIIFCNTWFVLKAQNDSLFNAFKKQAQQKMDDFRGQSQIKFERFRNENDSLYYTFLKESWVSLESMQPARLMKNPKPQKLPSVKIAPEEKPTVVERPVSVPPVTPAPSPNLQPPTVSVPPVTPAPSPNLQPPTVSVPPVTPAPSPNLQPPTVSVPPVTPAPSPNLPLPSASVPQVSPSPAPNLLPSTVSLSFYGMVMDFPILEKQILPKLEGEINQNKIAEFWKTASETDLQVWIKFVNESSSKAGGGFYATQRLLRSAIAASYRRERDSNNVLNNTTLLCWYLLLQNGYDIKVGYRKDKVMLLVHLKPDVYGLSFYRIGDKAYYLLPDESEAGSLQVCSINFPGNIRTCSLDVFPALSQPIDTSKIRYKSFSFEYQRKKQTIALAYFPAHIAYYERYPQMGFGNYQQSKEVTLFEQEVQRAFREPLRELNEKEKVQYLLSFVHSLPYQTDQQQFGKEKWMFPQEIIYYPYSDCDDRTIFFAFLVRQLIGLPVIGLLYPDHICTAIGFSGSVSGTSVSWKGREFIVCDPTYINSSVGMSMPQYIGVEAKIVE